MAFIQDPASALAANVLPASTAPTATDSALCVTISPNSPAISATVTDGTFEITDGVHGPAAVKAASTAPVATDEALVVAISPNTPTIPVSAASLPLPTGAATAANQTAGNTSLTTIATNTIGLVQTQDSVTSGQNGPLAQGAVTTAAPTYTSGHTDPLSLTPAGGLRVDGSAVTQPVSASSLPLPSGAATAANQTTIGTQTTELNDGTHSATIKAASVAPVATDTALVVAVSPNTPTLPVSAASLPLPSGAATSANQTTLGAQTTELNDGTHTATIKAASTAPVATDTALVVAISPNSPASTISGTVTANQGTPNTKANAWPTELTDGVNGPAAIKAASTAPVATDAALVVAVSPNTPTLPVSIAATVAVSAASLPLPTGAATSALQTTGNTTLATIASDLTTIGSQTTELNDGTRSATIKAASTAAVATDTALVVAISPNNTPVLPSGAATAANQATMIADLATIATNTGANSVDFTQSGTLTAVNQSVTVYGQGVYTISASITGTWAATLWAQGQLADLTWVTLPVYLVTGTGPYQAQGSITANGTYLITGGGYLQIRIYSEAFTSGTVNVALDGSLAQQTIFAAQLGAWQMSLLQPDVVASGALTASAAAVQVALAGYAGAGFQLAAGTFIGTIQFQESWDGGGTWNQCNVYQPGSLAAVSAISFGGANSAQAGSFMPGSGASHVRAFVSAYSSGTATMTLRATETEPNVIDIIGLGAAGTPAPGVMTVQGVTGGTAIPVVETSLDMSGTGTINVVNSNPTGTGTAGSYVALPTTGLSAFTLDITGTWSGTLAFQFSADGTNWITDSVLDGNTGMFVGSTTTNQTFQAGIAGYKAWRVVATAWTSGTANIAYDVGVGVNTVTAQCYLSDAQNNGPANVNPSVAGLQALEIHNVENLRQTYTASVNGLVAASGATDILTIIGSASKTVRVTRIIFTMSTTTAVDVPVQLIKRSSADTGGTSTAPAATPHDSNNAAATAVLAAYTANPSALGTLVGTAIRSSIYSSQSTFTSPAEVLDFPLGQNNDQPVVLRGVAQQLAINLGGTALAGAKVNASITWTEDNS